MKKVAIYDWGIGGMGTFHLFKKRFPHVPVVYFSDAGYTPYGKVPRAELQSRVQLVLTELRNMDCDLMLVACNAASTVLYEIPSDVKPITTAAIEAVKAKLPITKLAVLGGQQTIASHYYQTQLQSFCPLKPVVGQPLSALVEQGKVCGPEVKQALFPILDQLQDCSHVLLACTHYPALHALIARHSPHLQQIDPAKTLVDSLSATDPTTAIIPSDTFLTTASPDRIPHLSLPAFATHPELFQHHRLKTRS